MPPKRAVPVIASTTIIRCCAARSVLAQPVFEQSRTVLHFFTTFAFRIQVCRESKWHFGPGPNARRKVAFSRCTEVYCI